MLSFFGVAAKGTGLLAGLDSILTGLTRLGPTEKERRGKGSKKQSTPYAGGATSGETVLWSPSWPAGARVHSVIKGVGDDENGECR